MSFVREDGMETVPCAAEAVKEGYFYKIETSNYRATKTAAVDDKPFGVGAESSIEDDGDAKTLAAGDKMNFYSLGCGKKVKVAAITGLTLRRGAPLYLSQTAEADGCCGTSSSNSATKVAHYWGPDNLATTANGQLIDALLDVPKTD